MAKKNTMEVNQDLQAQIEELKQRLAQEQAEREKAAQELLRAQQEKAQAELREKRERILGVARLMKLGNNIVWLDKSQSGALGFSFFPVQKTRDGNIKTLAFVNVFFPQMVMRGFRLLANNKGQKFLSCPQEPVVFKDRKEYRPTVGLTDSFHAILQHDCIQAWELFINKCKKSGN